MTYIKITRKPAAYMLTIKNGFNGGCEYYSTHDKAVRKALILRSVGLIPEAIYKYNEATDKYDILIGKFTINPKEV